MANPMTKRYMYVQTDLLVFYGVISLMIETEIFQQMIQLCKMLNSKNMLAAGDGNLSYRLSNDRILITPRGRNKAFLSKDEYCLIDLENNPIKGQASTESLMHLEVYRSCPTAKAVIHAHPPNAIAWSISHPEQTEIPTDSLSEVILSIGKIPIATYARPGTADLAASIRPLIQKHPGVVMGRHGAIAWGQELEEAYNNMERLEHAALIMAIAEGLGGAKPLPTKELDWLRSQAKTSIDTSL